MAAGNRNPGAWTGYPRASNAVEGERGLSRSRRESGGRPVEGPDIGRANEGETVRGKAVARPFATTRE